MRLSLGLSLTSASVLGGGDTTAPVVVTSSYTDATQAVTLNIVEASGSATCYWALVANPSTPTEAQVVAGTGGGILESGSFTVTSGGDTDLINVTDETGNEIHIVIKDAAGNSTGTPSALNNTIIIGVVVDATAPSLSAATGVVDTATTATVGVTSNEAGGTVFFAARISTDGVLSKANIENGTGDAVSTGTDATPTADANNTATLSGLTEGLTYIVDVFQRDAYGNESAVVSSASWVNSGAYSANAVDLQGTWLASNVSYSGPAASKTGTLQLNVYCPTTWITSGIAYDFRSSSGDARLYFTFLSSGRMSLTGKTAAGTIVLLRAFTTSTFVADTWYTITVSWDLAAATCHVYIGDTQITSFGSSTTDNDFIEAIGRVYIPTFSPANASWLSDLYASDQFFDLTDTATRRQFVDANGKPVDKSSVGSPHLYLNGDHTNFEVNAGSGGNLTVGAGSLIAAGSSPTD